MAAMMKVLYRAFSVNSVAGEVLKQLLLFSGACLFIAILLLTNGLDLSPGFF